MYDTEKRVELVKKRVHEKYRRKKRRGICRLSALCTALSAFLVGTVHTAAGQTQITARGMYGSILLHEDAGGYVLVGVISFATAVMITVLCIRLREREHRRQGTGKGNASQQREGKSKKFGSMRRCFAVPWYFLWSPRRYRQRKPDRCRIPRHPQRS